MSGRKDLFMFRVSGNLKFPIRLLSSQKCFPNDEEDVFKISDSNLGNRDVTLISHLPPRKSEWLAEGWSIVYSIKNSQDNADNEYEKYHTWPC